MQLEYTKFYKLLDEPLVCVIASGLSFPSGVALCLKEAKGQPCHVLVMCFWYIPDTAKTAVLFKRQAAKEYPNLKLTYLSMTHSDHMFLCSLGVDSLHVSPNSLLNEKLFKLEQQPRKKYSAVHIASIERFKRHYLAWGIRRVAVITYNPIARTDISELWGYQEVGFVNATKDKGIVRLDREAVQKIIAESSCGLILSAKEGGNYASTEYLLCGIPVVSTASLGGRDEFFNPLHVKTVEANAAAIERAVSEWNENAPSPHEIRATVLLKMKEHRKRLLEWLGAISGKDHFIAADDNLWSPLFIDKISRDVAVNPNEAIKLWMPLNMGKMIDRFVRLFWKKRNRHV